MTTRDVLVSAIAPVLASLIAYGGAAIAECPPSFPAPGGGSKKTDCFAEFCDVPTAAGRKVVCDGGESCEVGDDGSCTFKLRICVNNEDPNLPLCTPEGVDTVTVKNRKKNPDPDLTNLQRAVDAILPAAVGMNTCTQTVEIPVPLKIRGSKERAGKRKIVIKAGSATTKRRDSEELCPSGQPPGIDQQCCVKTIGGKKTINPCFQAPDIVRTGTIAVAMPQWPDTTYPKTTTAEQGGRVAATFCIPATRSALVNNVAGLPGPGALLLPGVLSYEKGAVACPASCPACCLRQPIPSDCNGCGACPAGCPANPSGGPNQLVLQVVGQSDLDTGWTGISHNQGVVKGSFLCACLQDCDTTTDPECAGTGATGRGMINGTTFGPPLPLSTGGAPVCVVNEYAGAVTVSKADMQTGDLDIFVPLTARVHTGISHTRPCPTCSGGAIGQNGTCQGGPNNEKSCTVEGTSPLGNVSGQCPPNPPNNIGNLEITLDSTTGTRKLTARFRCRVGGGGCWCPGQNRMNDCDLASSPGVGAPP
jgi:hypothetical protein